MSESEELQRIPGWKRERSGTAEARRIRREGKIPAVVYGLGRGSQSLTIARSDVESLVKHSTRVFEVDVEGDVEEAMLRDLQWDTFGIDILHVDLLRIDAKQKITLEISIELKGQSPGVEDGGILEQLTQSVEVECFAHSVPDSVIARINHLEKGDSLMVSDLIAPPKTTILSPEDQVILTITDPAAQELDLPEEETEEVEATDVPAISEEASEGGEEENKDESES